jgi:hypothetical protein
MSIENLKNMISLVENEEIYFIDDKVDLFPKGIITNYKKGAVIVTNKRTICFNKKNKQFIKTEYEFYNKNIKIEPSQQLENTIKITDEIKDNKYGIQFYIKTNYDLYLEKVSGIMPEKQDINPNALMGPLSGRNGKLTIFSTYAELSRSWGAAFLAGMHGDKRIYFKDVGSVEYKKPGLAVGYIQFSVMGGSDSSGIFKTINNENAITFGDNEPQWKEAHSLILNLVDNFKNEVKPSELNSMGEIEKAYELLQKGIITENEFLKIKEKILK